MINKRKELLKFTAAMVIFGTNGYLVANISMPSAQIVLMRTLLGALFLLAVVMLSGRFDFKALRADLLPAALGGACLGLNWVLLFTAYREASVSLATLTYYCGPMLVLLFSPLLFKEKLTWNKLAAIAAVALGMVCISGNLDAQLGSGLVWAGGAALLYALLIVFNKRVKNLSGLHCALFELVIAFFVVLIYLAFDGGLGILIPYSDLPWVLAIGLVNTGLAYYLYFSSLQKLPAQTVALICYVDPLTALFVSALLLGEVLAPVQLLGAALILGGACLGEIVISKRKQTKKTN